MKKYIFILLSVIPILLFAQNNRASINAIGLVLGKNLKKIDKRFKIDKDYPNETHIVLEIVNTSNDNLFFFEYGNSLCIEKVKSDNSLDISCCFSKKFIKLEPNQKKFFLTGIAVSPNEKLGKCTLTIHCNFNEPFNPKNDEKQLVDFYYEDLKLIKF